MSPEHAPTLLVVDDDPAFNRVLLRALGQRGFDTYGATDSEGALELAQDHSPEFIVLDLNIGGESGLKLIRPLLEASPGVRILVLTGYASIATAVEAIKLGACHYLAKPSNTDDIEAAFGRAEGNAQVGLGERPTSIKTLEWERIHEVLAETGFNISEAARRLGMHRRTLARKMDKRQVN